MNNLSISEICKIKLNLKFTLFILSAKWAVKLKTVKMLFLLFLSMRNRNLNASTAIMKLLGEIGVKSHEILNIWSPDFASSAYYNSRRELIFHHWKHLNMYWASFVVCSYLYTQLSSIKFIFDRYNWFRQF